MNRYLRAWAMRWFHLSPTEICDALFKQNESLLIEAKKLSVEKQTCYTLMADLQAQLDDYKSQLWKAGLKAALYDLSKYPPDPESESCKMRRELFNKAGGN